MPQVQNFFNAFVTFRILLSDNLKERLNLYRPTGEGSINLLIPSLNVRVFTIMFLAVDGGYTIEIHIQNTVNMPRLQGEMT